MDWTLFTIFLGSCAVAAAAGSLFKPGPWYKALDKPDWTPPNWVFPLVWTTLYLLMALAATRVAMGEDNSAALALWGLQLALNTLWTPVFFGANRKRAGMVVILCLWAAVAATLVAFLRVDTLAGLLFVPYLAWVSLAGALNWSVWRLNRDVGRPPE